MIAATLTNYITALSELLSLKTFTHADPSNNIKKTERIVNDYFPGVPDNMMIALLMPVMRSIDSTKYQVVIDGMRRPGMLAPTYEEVKTAVLDCWNTTGLSVPNIMQRDRTEDNADSSETATELRNHLRFRPHAMALALTQMLQRLPLKNQSIKELKLSRRQNCISDVETAHEWKHTSAVERDAHTEYVKGNLSGESDMEFTFAITAHAKSRLEAFDFASDRI
ncbi:hypothetical protein RI054_45g153730 [Pseudoscourfieldia marina]